MDRKARATAIVEDVRDYPYTRGIRCVTSALEDEFDRGGAVMAGIIALGTWAAERHAANEWDVADELTAEAQRLGMYDKK